MFNRPLLGQILVERNALSQEALDAGLVYQAEHKGRLGEVLVELEHVTAEQVAQALATQLGHSYQPSFDLENIDLALLDKVPISYAREHHLLVVGRENGSINVFVDDPLNITTLDHIAFLYAARIEPIIGTPRAVLEAVNTAYDAHDRQRGDYGAVLDDEATGPGLEEQGFAEVVELLGQEDDEAPVIQFVNTTFVRAVRERASDIHIEPFEQYVSVRFRIDGVLKEVIEVPKRFQSSIAARIKIMSGLNIAEKRLPQDGRIRIKIAGKDIDIRVATAPTTQGERMTLRLLDQSAIMQDLETLGMEPAVLYSIDKLIRRPHGILLVTGPTGSGKTTTLYGCLSKINTPDQNILTIEDPVEYQLEGISQTPVNPKIDLTFATGMRSFLRHDPDVIMVGEIRDVETADIAIQASLTGHLVFSTIHTNDAAGAFTRLIDMGIEPFLVASSLLANMAQRLVRRLCEHCRIPFQPNTEELKEIGLTASQVREAGGYLFRPGECEECLQSGYHGRLGIFELLEVSDGIRKLVMERSDAGTIKRFAMSEGMRTLRQDGAIKVLRGLTSIEEVLRATHEELE
jgi:general secretion pathway protein E